MTLEPNSQFWFLFALALTFVLAVVTLAGSISNNPETTATDECHGSNRVASIVYEVLIMLLLLFAFGVEVKNRTDGKKKISNVTLGLFAAACVMDAAALVPVSLNFSNAFESAVSLDFAALLSTTALAMLAASAAGYNRYTEKDAKTVA